MQYVVLNLFDPVASRGLIPWVFAVAHLFYGGMFGLTLAFSRRPAPEHRMAYGPTTAYPARRRDGGPG